MSPIRFPISTNIKDLNLSYIKILDSKNKEIADKCGELILKIHNSNVTYGELSEIEKEYADFLIELDYLKYNSLSDDIKLMVPIIKESDRAIIDEISDIVLNEIFDVVKEFFLSLNTVSYDLTAIKHGVDIKEIANELWHQVFGLTNEYLVNVGFVASPRHIIGEGRYLKSFRSQLS